MKRKRDQENETREMRKLLNDKDERIKLLDNEIKVSVPKGGGGKRIVMDPLILPWVDHTFLLTFFFLF